MEATTTLAESLLDDLDDLSDVEDEQPQESSTDNNDDDITMTTTSSTSTSEANTNINNNNNSSVKVPAIKYLLDNPQLQSHLQTIRAFSNQKDINTTTTTASATAQKSHEEYNLIISSNHKLSSLSNEYSLSHSRLCEAYKPKFPELEELVVDPRQYRLAIQTIGNHMDMTSINEELNDILSSNQIITISVAGSTTAGRVLSACELAHVTDCVSYMQKVENVIAELSQFVEERMEGLAPNICAIVGAAIAARMLGLAGGLAELSKIPACNLQVMGQVKQNASSRGGMGAASAAAVLSKPNGNASNSISSSHNAGPHTGLIGECELVRKCPSYMRRKVVKAVASKLALATRVDYVLAERGKTNRDAEAGNKFRKQITDKIAKWDEPEKAQVVKALPKPDLQTKKRRGGKRIRRMKERFEETELMKQANRRAFSAKIGEYGDDAMGMTLGMLDTKEGGKLRHSAEKRAMRKSNTKASRKRAAAMQNVSGNPNQVGGVGGGAASGLASSMVFTPVQGLELVNPNANKDRVREANMKWFKEDAGFKSALPKGS